MQCVGKGTGLAAALLEAARPTTADVDSFVIAYYKIAAITSMFWVFKLTLPARRLALL